MASTRTAKLRAQIERLEQLTTALTESERAERLEALRAVQREYVDADATRKLAAATALATTADVHTVDELTNAMGYSDRASFYYLARVAGEGEHTFGGDVLAELVAIANRYAEAVDRRRTLVRSLRALPRGERLTLSEMGEAMGISSEGVRYLTRDSR